MSKYASGNLFASMKLKKYIRDLLLKIGLNDSEAELYLLAHEYPQKTLRELQIISGLSRASIYRAFERLQDLKLLTSSPENWRKKIEAVSLKTLATKVGKEQRKLRKTELELMRISNLMNLSNLSISTDPIELLLDQNQITEHCYKIISQEWDHIQCYGSAERLYEVAGEKAGADFVSMRSRKGRTCDAVFTELGNHTSELLMKNEKELRNGKLYIEPALQSTMTYIYNDEVTVWHKNNELGQRALVIHDPVLKNLFFTSFKQLWQRA